MNLVDVVKSVFNRVVKNPWSTLAGFAISTLQWGLQAGSTFTWGSLKQNLGPLILGALLGDGTKQSTQGKK